MKNMLKLLSFILVFTVWLSLCPSAVMAEGVAGDPYSAEPQAVFSDSIYDQGNGILEGSPPEGAVQEAPVPIDGLWQEFSWSGTPPIQARGCAPADPDGGSCTPSSGGNSEFAGAPPWRFTAPGSGAILTIVTDAFTMSDQFAVFDFDQFLGFTSSPGGTGSCGSDPELCLANANASKATFTLGPGRHSLTINVLAGSEPAGAAFFRIIEGGLECDGIRQDLETPNFVSITLGEGAGRAIGFRADETFTIRSLGILGALQNMSFDVVIYSSTDGHTAGSVLYTASGVTGGTGFDWNDISVSFNFTAGNFYVVNWRPTNIGSWATVPGLYYQNDAGLPYAVGPVTIVEGFEGRNAESPGNILHPRLRFCGPCDYCFEDTTNVERWCLNIRNEDANNNVWMDGYVVLSSTDIRIAVGTYLSSNQGLSLSADAGVYGVPFNFNVHEDPFIYTEGSIEGSLIYTYPSSPAGPINPDSASSGFLSDAPDLQGGNGLGINVTPEAFGVPVTVFQCGAAVTSQYEAIEYSGPQFGYEEERAAINKHKRGKKK